MKRTIQIGFVGVALLAGVVWWKKPRPTQPAPPRADSAVAPPSDKLPRERSVRVAPTNAALSTAWASVDSPDPARLMANLRAIGCPEQTIRDIVTFRVSRAYAERIRNLDAQADRDWDYTRNRRVGEDRKRRWLKDDLKLARDRELESLLGVTAETLQRETLGEDFSSREDLPTLSLEKRARLRELNLRFRQQTELARAGVPSWDTDSGVEARIRELDRQKDAELAAFLAPQELEELKFRASPSVQYALTRLPEAGSESEFRQMVGVVEEIGLAPPKMGPSRWPGVSRRLGLAKPDEAKAEQERAEKEERLNVRLKEVLGEARLAELERAEQARSAASRVTP